MAKKKKSKKGDTRGYSQGSAAASATASASATALRPPSQSSSSKEQQGQINNHGDSIRISKAMTITTAKTATTTTTACTKFHNKLTSITSKLETLSITPSQIESVVTALQYEITLEKALDWLCWNLDTDDLPRLFVDGRVRLLDGSNGGGGECDGDGEGRMKLTVVKGGGVGGVGEERGDNNDGEDGGGEYIMNMTINQIKSSEEQIDSI